MAEVLSEDEVRDRALSALAEEIETRGEGQARARATVAGTPLASPPTAARLERAGGEFLPRTTVEKILVEEELPIAPLFRPRSHFLAKERVKGLAPNLMGRFLLKNISIE